MVIRVGVFGCRRGSSMASVLGQHPESEVVALCDADSGALERTKQLVESHGGVPVCYSDFESFFNHDMDAVVLANYAHQHAPFAVRLLDSGRHVVSEVLACQTLGEGVALAEAVLRSGKVYTYAENYSYFRGTVEMQRLYRSGAVGEFLHGEGEYVHDCEGIWPAITYGQKDHWRVWTPSTFYCTHSVGPIMTITGTRPVRVTAYETPNLNARTFGRLGADGSVVVCQMSNGATAKFLPWCNYRRHPESIWYSVYGSKGMMETDRWSALFNQVNLYADGEGDESGEGGTGGAGGGPTLKSYIAQYPLETELSQRIGGHGGSDFFTMQAFIDSIIDGPTKETAIDVFQAIDMTLPGILGYRSIMSGNAPMDVPDLRDAAMRDKYRDDNWCVDPTFAGADGPPPSCSAGRVKVEDAVYERIRSQYEASLPKKG